MSYKDQTKIRRRVMQLGSSCIFSALVKETIDAIHALKLFYEVGTQIRVGETTQFPACHIRPVRAEVVERHLSGMRENVAYYINPVFIVKHPNDSIITQQVLYLASQVRAIFAKDSNTNGPFIFSSVAGHFDTIIDPVDIEPLQLIGDNTLAFNSGINIVFSVWKAL